MTSTREAISQSATKHEWLADTSFVESMYLIKQTPKDKRKLEMCKCRRRIFQGRPLIRCRTSRLRLQ